MNYPKAIQRFVSLILLAAMGLLPYIATQYVDEDLPTEQKEERRSEVEEKKEVEEKNNKYHFFSDSGTASYTELNFFSWIVKRTPKSVSIVYSPHCGYYILFCSLLLDY